MVPVVRSSSLILRFPNGFRRYGVVILPFFRVFAGHAARAILFLRHGTLRPDDLVRDLRARHFSSTEYAAQQAFQHNHHNSSCLCNARYGGLS